MPMEREIESVNVKNEEKKKKKKSFLFPFLCRAKQRLFFLPVCWHCFGLSFPKQPSETNLYILDKNSHFTARKVDEILQIISEYMGLRNVVIHVTWGGKMSQLMDKFDNGRKISATGVIKTAFC